MLELTLADGTKAWVSVLKIRTVSDAGTEETVRITLDGQTTFTVHGDAKTIAKEVARLLRDIHVR
jgi:hypothetical protein